MNIWSCLVLYNNHNYVNDTYAKVLDFHSFSLKTE